MKSLTMQRKGFERCFIHLGLVAGGVALSGASTPLAAQPGMPAAIEEVTVTARRMEEDVQDVPISVDVLGGDLLDDSNITRPVDLQFNVPGLVINNFSAGARFTLRGVGDEGGSGLSVATHLNGVYLGSANLAVARMFDLERVEVLKGPQGTLYGRNATGGTINFITRGAQLNETSGAIEASYGSFDTMQFQGNFNTPLGERAALRIAAAGSDGDGYIDNTVDDREFGEDDFWSLRASLTAELSDRFDLSATLQRVEDTGGRGQVWMPRPDFLVDPSDIHLTTVTLDNAYQETISTNADLILNYDLGFATLKSITGYSENENREERDCAGQPVLQGCVRNVLPAIYEQWSQEIQLFSNGDGPIDWLLGAYYFDSTQEENFFLLIPVINSIPQSDARNGLFEESAAVFGQVTYNFTDQFRLTGGLRYTDEKRGASTVGDGFADSPVLLEAEDSWTATTWRFDAQYDFSDDIMGYFSISEGFKSGGISTDILPDGSFDSFDPEELLAYEAGLKSILLDGALTLNGAAFYYDFTDLQVLSTQFVGGELVGQVDNAAAVEIYGLELSSAWDVTDSLSFSFGGLWMPKREFVEFEDATGIDLSGNEVSRAPEVSITSAVDYSVDLQGAGSLKLRLEYNYRTDFFFLKENNPVIAQDNLGLLNAVVRFESSDGKWYLFGTGRNLTDENYFTQIGFQSASALPINFEVGAGYRF